MTPALPDILTGIFLSLNTPLPPEAAGDYMAGRLGLLALIAILAAQEAERGTSVRIWENAAMEKLLGDTGSAPIDATWTLLDERNADLRRRLIAHHEAAEARGDSALDLRILELYQAMAKARRLELPGSP